MSSGAAPLLANDTRREIVVLLGTAGEARAGEIARALGRKGPSVSRHLALLLDAGLVGCRPAGPARHYALIPERAVAAWNELLRECPREVSPLGSA